MKIQKVGILCIILNGLFFNTANAPKYLESENDLVAFAHVNQEAIKKALQELPKETLFTQKEANALIKDWPIEVIAYRDVEGTRGPGYVYQLKVLDQNTECTLSDARKRKSSEGDFFEPAFGATCAYNAHKNSAFGVLMVLAYRNLEECMESHTFSCEDKKNSFVQQAYNIKELDPEVNRFLETISAQVLGLTPSQSFVDQGISNPVDWLIIKKMKDTLSDLGFNELNSQKFSPSLDLNHLDFKVTKNSAIDYLKNSLNKGDGGEWLTAIAATGEHNTDELLRSIARFRLGNLPFGGSSPFLHSFIISINATDETGGYAGQNHAISLIVYRKGSSQSDTNFLLLESNNYAPLVEYQLIEDFVELFINEDKYPMSPEFIRYLTEEPTVYDNYERLTLEYEFYSQLFEEYGLLIYGYQALNRLAQLKVGIKELQERLYKYTYHRYYIDPIRETVRFYLQEKGLYQDFDINEKERALSLKIESIDGTFGTRTLSKEEIFNVNKREVELYNTLIHRIMVTYWARLEYKYADGGQNVDAHQMSEKEKTLRSLSLILPMRRLVKSAKDLNLSADQVAELESEYKNVFTRAHSQWSSLVEYYREDKKRKEEEALQREQKLQREVQQAMHARQDPIARFYYGGRRR